jgi:hypothetical protein
VRERVRGHHEKLVKALCDKLVEAHELNVKLNEFRNAIHQKGASTITLP